MSEVAEQEFLHVECDCVPNLGPSHCHLCGRLKKPIAWPCEYADAMAAHDERVRTEATLVQHLWNEGKPFCGDESARPWYPADREESLARPVCALCHKRAITYARTEERERCAQIAERHPIPFNAVAQYPVRAGIAAAIRAVSAEQEDHHG